jgi:hypothetical protein
MENIVNALGGLPVTMDDWFDWLRDEVVGIGMTREEEKVIRSNFELISLFVYFLIFLVFLFNFLFFFFSLLIFFVFVFSFFSFLLRILGKIVFF